MTEEEIKHDAWKNAVGHYGTSKTKESTAYEKGYTEGVSFVLSRLTEKDKHITELTLKIRGLERDCDAYNYSQRTYQEQIKEAIEIIRMFVDECKMARAYPDAKKMWYREIERAEQFLGGTK